MKKIVESLNTTTNDNTEVQRRRFPRRSNDTCIVTIAGMAYPVTDWSMSGVLFEADTRTFANGENLPMTLKFRTGGTVAKVDVTGDIVRKNSRYVATQFAPLSTKAEQTFHKIIDGSIGTEESAKQA